MLKIIQLVLLTALLIGSLAVRAATPHEYRLDNGLNILVLVDRRAPIVISQIWYKVGSTYEHDGITGVSHALEHMMFKGTQTLAPGEFSEIIARHGGRENAFTGRNYTAYFQRIHRDNLELCLRLEAERMRGLKLDARDWAKEKEVIKEERLNRTDDRPSGLTFERFYATAFATSPTRNPIIGWMHDIDALTVADLRAWYDAWYAPNNATLVVAGDLDPEEVLRLARRHFGPLRARAIAQPKPRPELPQRGAKRLDMRIPAKVPYLVMGYKVPPLLLEEQAGDAYALELLAGILDRGESARLQNALVRDTQIAVSAGASYELYDRLPTLLLLDATPAADKTLQSVEAALRAEVQRLRDQPVSEAELQRVKTQIIASDVYGRDSLFYQAMKIGIAETVGVGYALQSQYLEGVRAVTPADIQRVAKKYLVDARLTVATMEPDDA